MPHKGKRRQPRRHIAKTQEVDVSRPQPPGEKQPEKTATPVKIATRQTQTPVAFSQARHPYLGAELKKITILTAVILVILVLLAIFLPGLLP